ncbi:MAG: hypothetical protein JNJ60_24140 [Rhodocyclaceae bacterium]|nr:hypothetical protein [Rhodocyclaceae bacterium]
MVRGGSWNNNRDNARCTYRNRNHPGNRNNNLGFRVLCVSHIEQIFEPASQYPGRRRAARRSGIAGRLRLPGRGEDAADGSGRSRPHG